MTSDCHQGLRHPVEAEVTDLERWRLGWLGVRASSPSRYCLLKVNTLGVTCDIGKGAERVTASERAGGSAAQWGDARPTADSRGDARRGCQGAETSCLAWPRRRHSVSAEQGKRDTSRCCEGDRADEGDDVQSAQRAGGCRLHRCGSQRRRASRPLCRVPGRCRPGEHGDHRSHLLVARPTCQLVSSTCSRCRQSRSTRSIALGQTEVSLLAAQIAINTNWSTAEHVLGLN